VPFVLTLFVLMLLVVIRDIWQMRIRGEKPFCSHEDVSYRAGDGK
jgi:hypothetical protein